MYYADNQYFVYGQSSLIHHKTSVMEIKSEYFADSDLLLVRKQIITNDLDKNLYFFCL